MPKEFKKEYKKNRTRNRGCASGLANGFTLIEALVAVAIVLVGVTAVFGTAQSGLSSTSGIRNQVTAMFLAQEALEGVKNLKDVNLMRTSNGEVGVNWLEGISTFGAPCYPAGTECGYDVTGDAGNGFVANLQPCDGSGGLQGCAVMTDSTGLYRQMVAGGTPTGFVRKIKVEETLTPDGNPSNYEAKVTVTISRTSGSFQPFTVTGFIYNWF